MLELDIRNFVGKTCTGYLKNTYRKRRIMLENHSCCLWYVRLIRGRPNVLISNLVNYINSTFSSTKLLVSCGVEAGSTSYSRMLSIPSCDNDQKKAFEDWWPFSKLEKDCYFYINWMCELKRKYIVCGLLMSIIMLQVNILLFWNCGYFSKSQFLFIYWNFQIVFL